MATLHRQTGTAKSNRTEIVIPAYNEAWSAFESSIKVDDLDALRKEGWRTIDDVVKSTGQTAPAVRGVFARSNGFEKREIRVFCGRCVRVITAYRPKVTG